MMCHKDAGLNGIYEKCPVGRKKVPSWKKTCFQLEKFFSLTGNPVLGGHWHFPAFAPYFTLKGFSNTGKDVVKRFDRIEALNSLVSSFQIGILLAVLGFV